MGFSQCLSQFLSFILFLLHFHITISSSFSSSNSTHLCAPHQTFSLLQFKQSFSIDSSASWNGGAYPKTESWKEGIDCCLWDGVTCDMKTGQVIGLNLAYSMLYGTFYSNNSLFSLHHLQKLDLSDNDFNRSHISSQFGQFSNLTHLNLSFSGFVGQVPLEVSHLSKLVSLDLSTNYLSLEPISFDKLARNLTSLRELDLSSVNMSLVLPNSLMKLSSSLSSLKLSNCRLQGKFPSSVGKLKHLQYLDLGWNNFTGSIPYDFEQLTELVSLQLSYNYYLSLEKISFDNIFQNLTKLSELGLSGVNMSLVAPNSLMNLSSSLSFLDLSDCGLQGKFPGNIFLLPNLESLDLGYNEGLTGSFPSSNFSSVLRVLGLSNTRILVFLEKDLISNLKSLQSLSLRNCNIIGSDLALLDNLTQLTHLNLESNNLNGQIPSSLGNLIQLHYLILRFNNFIGEIPHFLGSLMQLSYLDLSYNHLIGPIPAQISALLNLWFLHLSDNLFHGTIPSFLFALPPLRYLYLYNNQLTGNISEFQHNSLMHIDLSNSHLHGPIPSSIFKLENLTMLILASNSNLTGEISSSICKLKFLQVLDLSNNSLSGFIPRCMENFSNNLQGTIPLRFSEGNSLGFLNLNDNELEGEIPSSIINCTLLEVLDLGNNKIEGTFPYFLETLPELKVLVLKSNELKGYVKGPTTNNSFSKLRNFDISSNSLSGPLPTLYFNSLEAMMASDQNMIYMSSRNFSNYVYSVKMTWKGLEIKFVQIQSTLRALDFSNNNFTGEILELIGKLTALQQLNLSHNSLVGHIQSSLGMLTKLESLDLSSNLLSGRIPVQLVDLGFLGVLNLSHDQLEGPIPSGKQFDTFDQSSFQGNLDLCGFSMPKKCHSGEAPPLPPSNFIEKDDSTLFEEGFGWKAVAMGYGCGFVFGVTMGYIVFRTRKPAWFLKMIEDKWNLKSRKTKSNARRNGAARN